MQTDPDGIDIELFNTQMPLTVEKFLNQANRGDNGGTFIHHNVPGFVIQGEGDYFGSGTSRVPVDSPVVVNEPDPVNRPNVHGILARAKDSDPDSATSSEINASIVCCISLMENAVYGP
jgi:cyclophilin family peptidyl-prolyl cis-trans isomerase